MTAPLDFTEQAFDDVGGTLVPVVFFWKVIEGQASLQIAAQTSYGARVESFILGDKCG